MNRRLKLHLLAPAAWPVSVRVSLLGLVVAGMAPALGAAEGDEKPDHSITHQGLSGLFSLITPDTLNQGQVSFGLIHRNYDRELSDLDVNDLAAAFGIGVTRRLEVGMSYVANRQVDFDDRLSGAYYNNFPFPVSTIGNGGGDLYAGVKVAIARIEEHGNGLSLFGRVKFPTANEDHGRGTGNYDWMVGAAAGMVRGVVGFYGNAGYTFVGDARSPGGDVDLANVFTYGVGLEFGARSWFKAIAELTGERFVNEKTPFFRAGEFHGQEDAGDLALGFKLGGAGHSGFTLGAAWVRNIRMADTNPEGEPSRPTGWVAEITYTSSEKVLPPPPPIPPSPLNHPPTCSITVTPAEIFPSFSQKTHAATLTAQGSDPDGDSLTYSWTASGGSIGGSGSSVSWNPPDRAETGTFTVTAEVKDGSGGEATCTATVGIKPDAEFFEGRVQFEFDRYDLSDEARQTIQRAADHLRRFPTLKVTLEGHCCYIATEEYNLQLGQQRAESIRAYLSTLGVDATRVSTISYGETRPWQDNSREITRRLNRRGEFRFKFNE